MRWCETQPGPFYAGAFLASYIMLDLFQPLIDVAEAAMALVHGQLPLPPG